LLKNIILSVAFFMFFADVHVSGQQQSGRVYEFLNLPATARITALGGYAFPSMDNDLGMALFYPALLTQDVNNHISLNFVDYFDDINYGTVAFAHYFERLGQFSGAMQYIDYGRFVEANESGDIIGRFTAGEYSFQIGWGRQLTDRLMIGSNLKVIYSSFYTYDSMGMAVDLSMAYINPDQLLSAAIVARNIGRQITYYHGNSRESLPFDLAVGVSKKLRNAPFRLSLVANNLHNYKLVYDSPLFLPDHFGEDDAQQKFQGQASDFGDNLMRHITLGLEFTPLESFSFRMGYNYRRRQEMKVDSRLSTVGFSWGFGIQISRFQLQYGRSNYHLAGAPNHISISTSLQDLFQQSNNQRIEVE
jgi:hypothetical protein